MLGAGSGCKGGSAMAPSVGGPRNPEAVLAGVSSFEVEFTGIIPFG